MKLKEKIILSSVITCFGTVINLFFTAALHGLLSRQFYTLTLIPLGECITGLFTQKQQLLMFLSFEGFIVLCCVLFYVQNNRPYQSDLVKIAEDIFTPASVGQYQHGSARWLWEQEKDKAFQSQIIDPNNTIIRELLEIGYDNLPFLQQKHKSHQEPQPETGQSETAENAAEALPISIKQQKPKRQKVAEKVDNDFETVDFELVAVDLSQEPPQEIPPSIPPLEDSKQTDPYKLYQKGGIVIGMTKDRHNGSGELCEKLHYISSDTHTLTIGATRSGKTRCLVSLSACWGLPGKVL